MPQRGFFKSLSSCERSALQTNVTFPRFEKLQPSLRHRILDAALKEFGRFGYGGASMNRLVKGAGISKGALFKYFGTKAGLFDYVYRASLGEIKEQLRAVRDGTQTEPFFDRLEKVIRAVYTGDAPHGNRILSEIQGTSRRFLKTLIEDGVSKGELRKGIDAERTAFIIQSVLDRFLQAHYLEFMAPALDRPATREGSDPSSSSEKWILEMTDLFRTGIGSRALPGSEYPGDTEATHW
jgi:AcrR family transcriptional regulator